MLTESFINIYEEYVTKGVLDYVCCYKFSQDHLELLFAVFRSRLGYNNNPTAKQFIAAYRQILCNKNIKAPDTGNCIQLDCDINEPISVEIQEDIESDEFFEITNIIDINPVASVDKLNLNLSQFQ